MAARKKVSKKAPVKKSAPKKSPSRSQAKYVSDEKNHFIIIGGVVAIVLFMLAGMMIQKNRDENKPQPQQDYVNIEAPTYEESSPSAE